MTGMRVSISFTLVHGTPTSGVLDFSNTVYRADTYTPVAWRFSVTGSISSMRTAGLPANKFLARKLVARFLSMPSTYAFSSLALLQVPVEFQTQVPTYANPPTLAMAVTAFITRFKQAAGDGPSAAELGIDYSAGSPQTPLSGSSTVQDSKYFASHDTAVAFARSLYEPLKRHYEWFRRTQRGQIKQYSRQARSRTEAYRWRGRSATHVLTSGMDDYPRGPPHAGELHLDLISWMAFFSRTMREISSFIGEEDDAATYVEIERAIIDNIDGMCCIRTVLCFR